MDKISLRRLARERRRGIRPEIRERAGELLARSFLFSHPALAGARVVGGYLSLPGELPPEPLMAALHAAGRIVAVPPTATTFSGAGRRASRSSRAPCASSSLPQGSLSPSSL